MKHPFKQQLNTPAETLPAIQSQEFRQEQMARFTDSIGEIGDCAKEIKTAMKWQAWLGIAVTALFLLVIGIGIWLGGGINGFLDLEVSARSFNCTSTDYHDTVRSYTDASAFTEMYGGECVLLKKGVKT